MENQFKKGDLLISKEQNFIVKFDSYFTEDTFSGIVVTGAKTSYKKGYIFKAFRFEYFELYESNPDFIDNINTALDTLEQILINRNEKVM